MGMIIALVIATALMLGQSTVIQASDGPYVLAVQSWDGKTPPVLSYQSIVEACTQKLNDLSKTESATPQDQMPYLWRRGLARYRIHDFTNAYVDLSRCIELAPNNKDVMFAFARAAVIIPEHRDRGIAVGSQLTKEPMAAAFGYCVLGIAKYMNHAWTNAEAEFSTAIARQPDWTEPYLWRGLCRFRLSKWRGCVSDMETVIAHPQTTTLGTLRCRVALTIALSQLGDKTSVEGNLIVLNSRLPKEGSLRDALWFMLTWNGRYGEALEVARRHTEQMSHDPGVWRRYALSLAQAGRLDAAMKAAHKAIDAGLTNPESWGALGRVELLRGDYKTARLCFRREAVLANADKTKVNFQDAIRIVLLLAACPDYQIRDALAAVRTAKKFPLPTKPKSRRQLLVLQAAAVANNGQREQATRIVDEALTCGPIMPDEENRLNELRNLFASGKSYKHDWTRPEKQLIRMAPAEIVGLDDIRVIDHGQVDNILFEPSGMSNGTKGRLPFADAD